jgi:hypothetical protein
MKKKMKTTKNSVIIGSFSEKKLKKYNIEDNDSIEVAAEKVSKMLSPSLLSSNNFPKIMNHLQSFSTKSPNSKRLSIKVSFL